MLYMGGKPLISIGKGNVITKVPTHDPKYIGSLHVKNTYLALYGQSIATTPTSPHLVRAFDMFCYKYGNASTATNKAAVGGFEIEMTFQPDEKTTSIGTVFGLLGGTGSTSAGVGIYVGTSGKIGMRAGRTPSRQWFGESLWGRKVTARLIILPTTSETYAHAYSGHLIVTDATTNEELTNETVVFGDNLAKDMMVTNQTNFYRFQFGLFYEANNSSPLSVVYNTQTFQGYFWGGKIYVNPTGLDETIPQRTVYHVFTPVQKGKLFTGSGVFSGSAPLSFVPNSDGVYRETINLNRVREDHIYNERGTGSFCPVGTNFASHSERQYID